MDNKLGDNIFPFRCVASLKPDRVSPDGSANLTTNAAKVQMRLAAKNDFYNNITDRNNFKIVISGLKSYLLTTLRLYASVPISYCYYIFQQYIISR